MSEEQFNRLQADLDAARTGDAAEDAAADAKITKLQSDLDAARSDDETDAARIAALEKEVADLTQDPTPTRRSMLVGASNAVEGRNDPVPLEQGMGLTGGQQLDLLRCYASGPGATWGNTDFGSYVGKRGLWISMKGDVAAYGNPNSTIIQNCINLAKTYPEDGPQCDWTIWHEIQPKLVNKEFTFAQIKKAINTWYDAVKPFAPNNMRLGPIHGGFGWRPGSDQTTIPSSQNPYCASPAEWRTLKGDFQGLDAYGGPKVEDLLDMARVQRFITEMLQGDVTKLGIAESGMRQSSLLDQANGDAAKANDLGCAWLIRNGNDLGTAGAHSWCLWNSSKTEDPGPITDKQEHAYGDVWRGWSPMRP